MEVVVVCEFSYKVEYNLENLERKKGIRYFPKIKQIFNLERRKGSEIQKEIYEVSFFCFYIL